MKANKLLLTPVLMMSFVISACNGTNNTSCNCQCDKSIDYNDTRVAPDGMFYLNLIDEENYVINKNEISDKYVPNSEIYFYVNIIPDTHLFLYRNGMFSTTPVVVEHNGQNVWQYRFYMPEHNATVEFKKSSLDSVTRNIKADYGQHSPDRVSLLFGDMKIPDLSGIYSGKIIAGDYVTIIYDGLWMEFMTYPSKLDMGNITLKDVVVTHGTIFNFEVLPVPGGDGDKDIVQMDGTDAGSFLTEYCINQDGTFAKLDTYPAGTKLYGINPVNYDSKNIVAFYSYDPLA